jgi:hypothetical protein
VSLSNTLCVLRIVARTNLSSFLGFFFLFFFSFSFTGVWRLIEVRRLLDQLGPAQYNDFLMEFYDGTGRELGGIQAMSRLEQAQDMILLINNRGLAGKFEELCREKALIP